MIKEILIFSFCISVFWIICQSIGIFSFWIARKKNYGKNFIQNSVIEVFIGVLIFVSIVSIFKTYGRTVFSIIPFFIFFFFKLAPSAKFNKSFYFHFKQLFGNFKYLLWVFIVPFIVNLFSIYYELSPDTENDVIFYSKVAEHIKNLGTENTFIQIDKPIHGVQFYHFFEFWITVIFSFIFFKTSTVLLLKYITYSFLKTFFVIGVLSISIEKLNWNLIFLPILILFISLAPIDWILNYKNQTHFGIYTNFWYRPNFLTYNFILIVSILFLKIKLPHISLLCLLVLPITSITTAPVVISSVLLITLHNYLKNKTINLSVILFLIVELILLVILAINSKSDTVISQNIGINQNSLELVIKTLFSHLRVALYVLYHHGYRLFAFCFFVMILNYKKSKFNFQLDIVYWCFIFNIVGIVLLILTMPIFNGYQSIYVSYSLLFCLFSIGISQIWTQKSILKKTLVFVVSLLGLLSIPTNDSTQIITKNRFNKNIKSLNVEDLTTHCLINKNLSISTINDLKKYRSHFNKIGLYVNIEDIKDIEPRHRYIPFTFGNEFSYLKPRIIYYSVTPSTIIYSDLTDENYIHFKPIINSNNRIDFYQKNISRYKDIVRYINEKNIDTVVLSSENNEFEKLLDVKICITDENTKKVYLLLNSNYALTS